jgi:signal transduction histidine kinase
MVMCFNWRKGSLSYYWGVFAQGIIGFLCLSLFLSLWTARMVSKPMAELRDRVVRMAGGDLSVRIEEKGSLEISELARAVNGLTENLSRHTDSMKQLMINISHEMRSSLTNAGLSLGLSEEALASLARFLPDGEKKDRLIRNLALARDELTAMGGMAESGLLGGKLELRHEGLDQSPLDFSSLCRQAVARHASRAMVREIDLVGRIEPGLWLMGDEIILDRLLANILDNAVKYTLKGGRILLALALVDGNVLLSCLNTHPPLGEDELKNLCLPYYRADQGRSHGSGLGMYLAARIASLHGGSLTAENAADGLLISVTLPLPEEMKSMTILDAAKPRDKTH